MKAPNVLRETLEMMHQELECMGQNVILVPASKVMHQGHMVRMEAGGNPDWYRVFCSRYSSSRRTRLKHDTCIKRQGTLKLLKKLSEGQDSMSIYAQDLLGIAYDLQKQEHYEKNGILKSVPSTVSESPGENWVPDDF